MCKLIKETKQIIKACKKENSVISYRARITVESFLQDYKDSAKAEVNKQELLSDTLEYRKQYLN